MAYRLSTLAEHLSGIGMPCEVHGDADREVVAVSTLEDAGADEIGFLANPKYEAALKSTAAAAVIVSSDQKVPAGLAVLRVPEPYAAVTAVIVHIHGYRHHKPVGVSDRAVVDPAATVGKNADIHPTVTIAAGATIGRNVYIYPGVYIGENCRLGDDCVLYPNVVIYDNTILGDRVTVHAGSVIGEDGLGYAPVGEKWRKIPQVGIVEIGDDVEIGANCAIDRATLGRTVIAAGTKFSNLVAIGHGTKIGENCMFVAQVGVAGSVTVGKHVTMAGKVGVAGHLEIGDYAELSAMCGVMKNVPPKTRVAGVPAVPSKHFMRAVSIMERLPQMAREIKQLQAELDRLKQTPAVHAQSPDKKP